MNEESRDGFLFVGNELCLDFLNTSLVMEPGAAPIEMLPDVEALGRWMQAAELITAPERARLVQQRKSPAMATFWQFRHHLRDTVFQIESGGAPAAAFVALVNGLLRDYPHRDVVTGAGMDLVRSKRFEPQSLLDLFAPLADSVATLLTLPDKERLRKCDSCVIHFLDVSKKGTRSPAENQN